MPVTRRRNSRRARRKPENFAAESAALEEKSSEQRRKAKITGRPKASPATSSRSSNSSSRSTPSSQGRRKKRKKRDFVDEESDESEDEESDSGNEESGEDENSNKVGNKRKLKKVRERKKNSNKTTGMKRNKVRRVANAPDDNVLFKLTELFSFVSETNGDDIDSIIEDWAVRYIASLENKTEDATITRELLSFILVSCIGEHRGPSLAIIHRHFSSALAEEEDVNVQTLVNELCAEEWEDDLYPLNEECRKASRLKVSQRFRARFCEFWSSLPNLCGRDVLFQVSEEGEESMPLVEKLIIWLSTISSGAMRCYRHTAALAAYELVAALLKMRNGISADLTITQRRRRTLLTALKKKKENPTQFQESKLKKLSSEINDGKQKIRLIEESVKETTKAIFMHRQDDFHDFIRVEAVTAFGRWMVLAPNLMKKQMMYLPRRFGDNSYKVRLATIEALSMIYEETNLKDLESLESFAVQHADRIIDMVEDINVSVRKASLRLILALLQNNFLDDDEEEEVENENNDDDNDEKSMKSKAYRYAELLLFDETMSMRRAAADFLINGHADFAEESDDTTKLLALVRVAAKHAPCTEESDEGVALYHLGVHADSCKRVKDVHHIQLVASAFFGKFPILQNWDLHAATLLKNPNEIENNSMNDYENALLAGLFAACAKLHQDRKPRKADAKTYEASTKQLGSVLIKSLTPLLRKFQADAATTEQLASLLQFIDIEIFAMHRQRQCFKTIINVLSDIFLIHSDDGVLQTIANTFLYLTQGTHSFVEEAHVGAQTLTGRIVERLVETLEEDRADLEAAMAIDSIKETHEEKQEADKETNLVCLLRRLRSLFEKIDIGSSLPVTIYEHLHDLIKRRTEDNLKISKLYREKPASGVVTQSLVILFTSLAFDIYSLRQKLKDQARVEEQEQDGEKNSKHNEDEERDAKEREEMSCIVQSLCLYRDNISSRIETIMNIDRYSLSSRYDENVVRAYQLAAYQLGCDMRSLLGEAACEGFGSSLKGKKYSERGYSFPLASLRYSMPDTLVRNNHSFFNAEVSDMGSRDAMLKLKLNDDESESRNDILHADREKIERQRLQLFEESVNPLFPPLARVLLSNPKAKREATILISYLNKSGAVGRELVQLVTKALQRPVDGQASYVKVQMAALRYTYRQIKEMSDASPDDDDDDETDSRKVYQAYSDLLALASRLSSFYGVGTVPPHLREIWEENIISGIKFSFQDLPNQLGFLDILDYYVRKLPKAGKASVLEDFQQLSEDMQVTQAFAENERMNEEHNSDDSDEEDDADVRNSMWSAYTSFKTRLADVSVGKGKKRKKESNVTKGKGKGKQKRTSPMHTFDKDDDDDDNFDDEFDEIDDESERRASKRTKRSKQKRNTAKLDISDSEMEDDNDDSDFGSYF
eukprot:g516.t1